jgi:hypothetical protein
MDADNNLVRLKNALETILNDFLERKLPLRRIAFLSSILRLTANECNSFLDVNKRILAEQKEDGGWIDCEDTIWNAYILSFNNSYSNKRQIAIEWLNNERPYQSGWGFCKRDYPNIPLTAQALFFIPELRFSSAVEWLEKAWDIDLNSPVNLNYKGAWYLLVAGQNNPVVNIDLFKKTIEYLIREQRENGAWGPWKDHPAPVCTFTTGLTSFVLAKAYAIMQSNEILACLRKSIEWFKDNQLQNGLFPTHYIEEGSGWCYLGWQAANICLS